MKKYVLLCSLFSIVWLATIPQELAANEGSEAVSSISSCTQWICPALGVYGDPTLTQLHTHLKQTGHAPTNLQYVGEQDRFGLKKLKVYSFSQIAFRHGEPRKEYWEACTPDGERWYVVQVSN